jgi:hypothetical protein
VPALAATTTVMAQTCLANFSGTLGSQKYTFTPYTHTITPIDGTVGNFTAGETVLGDNCLAGCAASVSQQHGYITYDAANVYLGVDSVPSGAAGMPYAAIYFGTGGAGGATKDLPLFAGNTSISRNITAGANIQWALEWNTTTTTTAPLWFTWQAGSGSWMQAASYPGTFGSAATNSVEFSIPLSTFSATPASLTLYSFGAVLAPSTTAAPATEQFRWPGSATGANSSTTYDRFFADVLSSCLTTPATQQAQF